jgi:hypothetical protein
MGKPSLRIYWPHLAAPRESQAVTEYDSEISRSDDTARRDFPLSLTSQVVRFY